jgi:hypothetical protein
MPTAVGVGSETADALQEPIADVVSGAGGNDQFLAAGATEFCGSDRGRQGGRACMSRAATVVEVPGVGRGSVGECCVCGVQAFGGPPDEAWAAVRDAGEGFTDAT